MDELTDLEISIKIAKIKGLDVKVEANLIKRRCGTSKIFIPFIPFGFDCNCRLRDEFGVVIDYRFMEVYIPKADGSMGNPITYHNMKGINKAVLLAIIEAQIIKIEAHKK